MKTRDLKIDPHNANLGTDRGRQLTKDSVARFGLARPVLIDAANLLIAGNQTTKVLDPDTEVEVVETDGTEFVVHVREDLDVYTDPEAVALGIADNACAEAGLNWDKSRLVSDYERRPALQSFWKPFEIEDMKILGPSKTPEPPLPMLVIEVSAAIYENWQSTIASMPGANNRERFSALLTKVESCLL